MLGLGGFQDIALSTHTFGLGRFQSLTMAASVSTKEVVNCFSIHQMDQLIGCSIGCPDAFSGIRTKGESMLDPQNNNESRRSLSRRIPWGGSKKTARSKARSSFPSLLVPRKSTFPGELDSGSNHRHDTPNSHLLTDAPERAVLITCCDYSPDRVETRQIEDLGQFLDEHRPEWSRVRWINVEGLKNTRIIQALAEKYQLDPLAIEDMQRVGARPRSEDYPAAGDSPGRLFVICRMIRVVDPFLHDEQLSCFLGHHTLVTFEEAGGDFFDPVRQRIRTDGSRLRQGDASLLLHALLDCIVENLFPILEEFSNRLERLERKAVSRPDSKTMEKIHRARRELLLLRRSAWPMRDLISQLQMDRRQCLSESAQVYFRDIYSHIIHVIDLLETQREFLTGLSETYFSAVSNRMNEIVKTLTIISTVFVPLTFLAGVYGMNMPIPENNSSWSYPLFWLICIVVTVSMLFWFRRRRWI